VNVTVQQMRHLASRPWNVTFFSVLSNDDVIGYFQSSRIQEMASWCTTVKLACQPIAARRRHRSPKEKSLTVVDDDRFADSQTRRLADSQTRRWAINSAERLQCVIVTQIRALAPATSQIIIPSFWRIFFQISSHGDIYALQRYDALMVALEIEIEPATSDPSPYLPSRTPLRPDEQSCTVFLSQFSKWLRQEPIRRAF